MSRHHVPDLPELHRALVAAADARSTAPVVRARMRSPRALVMAGAVALVLVVLVMTVSASGAGRPVADAPRASYGSPAAALGSRTPATADGAPATTGVALVRCLLDAARTADLPAPTGVVRALEC